jgi:hypothetical protein
VTDYRRFYVAALSETFISGRHLTLTKNTEQTISSFAGLPPGWDYGSGGPIETSVIEAAIEWSRFFGLQGFRTDAFPGGEGEISVSASIADHYLEVIVEADLTISVAYDYQRKQVFYHLRKTDKEARAIVNDIMGQMSVVGQIWNASISLILENITLQTIGGVDPLSRTTRVLYPSLDVTVSVPLEQRSANMSVIISDTPAGLSAHHPFFGSLIQVSSQMADQ